VALVHMNGANNNLFVLSVMGGIAHRPSLPREHTTRDGEMVKDLLALLRLEKINRYLNLKWMGTNTVLWKIRFRTTMAPTGKTPLWFHQFIRNCDIFFLKSTFQKLIFLELLEML
jgi:hypothetical protein